MDYTEINSCMRSVESALQSAAKDLHRSNVNYGGIASLAEAQVKLIKAVCAQMEELHKRVQKLEHDKAP